LESLVHNITDLELREGLLAIFSELVDILIHVLEDKVQGVLVFDDFQEIHDVWVMKLHERCNFGQLNAVFPFGTFLLFHFFDRDDLTIPLVDAFHDNSESTITKSCTDFVFLHGKRRENRGEREWESVL